MLEIIKKHKKEVDRIELAPVPIEYRELFHPQKEQAQGVVELFTEVIPADRARQIQPSKIQVIKR
jgi:hypothetical protein